MATGESGGFVVEISQGCWLAPWTGDPGRTLLLANARRYKTKWSAARALSIAARRYKFLKIAGKVYRVETDASAHLVTDPPIERKEADHA